MGSEHPQQGLGSGCQKGFVTIFLRFPLNASAAGQLQSSPNRPVEQSENILQSFLKASRLSLYFFFECIAIVIYFYLFRGKGVLHDSKQNGSANGALAPAETPRLSSVFAIRHKNHKEHPPVYEI